MKTVYTVTFYGNGQQPDGMYEIHSFDEFFDFLTRERFQKREYVVIEKHEYKENPCEICSLGSTVESIKLSLNDLKYKIHR